MDKIKVQGLKLYAYHGVNPEEKVDGQEFILDIKAYLSLDLPCVSDNVDDTVSYAKIIKTARRAFLAEKYDLLEKAAQTVADRRAVTALQRLDHKFAVSAVRGQIHRFDSLLIRFLIL